MPKQEAVRQMFAQIAGRYDSANHWLSGGMDFCWRRRLAKRVQAQQPRHVLDVATGTGDVAFVLKRFLGEDAAITGVDFCEDMLIQARKKQACRKMTDPINFIKADCLKLPFEDNSFDAVTIVFGLRNLENRRQGLKELYRVLAKPNGVLYILEFTQPSRWVKPFYYFYLKRVLPLFAYCITGNRAAYQYLGGSISDFPTQHQLQEEIQQSSPFLVTGVNWTLSIVALHICTLS